MLSIRYQVRDLVVKRRIINRIQIISLFCLFALISGGLNPKPANAQAQNGFSEPEAGAVLSGIVIIKGTAQDFNFLRYELAFYQESRPGADWVVFAQGDQAVIDGTLAVWDTTVGLPNTPVFPDGRYRLRLRIVRQDYNYDEYFLGGLTISNESATPTATLQADGTTTLTPVPLSATDMAATAQFNVRALPSLTPFPTPTADSAQAAAPLGPAASEDSVEAIDSGGLLDQLTSIDTGRFGRAFLLGVRIVIYIFIALALYLLLRGLLRLIRRYIRSNWPR